MLFLGLTGGIGAGKSTVAKILAEHGITLIDADQVAREVVEPGTDALQRLVEVFGGRILRSDGTLNRRALAKIAFQDTGHTSVLNSIVHPAIGERTAELLRLHAADAIVVHDVPLLVERRMSPDYHLTILVDVPAEVRFARLTASRAMDPADIRARINAQATDAQRYAACDVAIDNTGTVEDTRRQVEHLLAVRLLPFADNLRLGRPASRSHEAVEGILLDTPADPVRRVVRRIAHGLDAAGLAHAAPEVRDIAALTGDVSVLRLVVRVADPMALGAALPVLARLGYPLLPDAPKPGPGDTEAVCRSCDPGFPVELTVLAG